MAKSKLAEKHQVIETFKHSSLVQAITSVFDSVGSEEDTVNALRLFAETKKTIEALESKYKALAQEFLTESTTVYFKDGKKLSPRAAKITRTIDNEAMNHLTLNQIKEYAKLSVKVIDDKSLTEAQLVEVQKHVSEVEGKPFIVFSEQNKEEKKELHIEE